MLLETDSSSRISPANLMESQDEAAGKLESRLTESQDHASSDSPVSSSSSGSPFSCLRVSVILLLLLSLCAHQVSSMPGASIDAPSQPGDSFGVDVDRREIKRETLCRRGTGLEIEKWDRCERCARATNNRDTFGLCCRDKEAEDYCKVLLVYRPPEFNKRPRSRRTPSLFNRLVRSALAHNSNQIG